MIVDEAPVNADAAIGTEPGYLVVAVRALPDGASRIEATSCGAPEPGDKRYSRRKLQARARPFQAAALSGSAARARLA